MKPSIQKHELKSLSFREQIAELYSRGYYTATIAYKLNKDERDIENEMRLIKNELGIQAKN